jgi:hypothetical protein
MILEAVAVRKRSLMGLVHLSMTKNLRGNSPLLICASQRPRKCARILFKVVGPFYPIPYSLAKLDRGYQWKFLHYLLYTVKWLPKAASMMLYKERPIQSIFAREYGSPHGSVERLNHQLMIRPSRPVARILFIYPLKTLLVQHTVKPEAGEIRSRRSGQFERGYIAFLRVHKLLIMPVPLPIQMLLVRVLPKLILAPSAAQH